MSETKELQPIIEGEYQVVRPLVSVDTAIAQWAEYQDLVHRLLAPSDYQTYTAYENGKTVTKRFKKKSAFRKMRRFFGFNLEVLEERIGHKHIKETCARLFIPDIKECGCPTQYARFIVRVTDPRSGQYVDGIGICSLGEKNRVFTKPDHEIPATAHTRAVNRGISDLIGAGEDSAEEVRGTSEVSGLSREEQATVRAAWQQADKPTQEAAIAKLREWSFVGETVAQIMTDFKNRAGDEAVHDLVALLTHTEAPAFDPDAVPTADEPPVVEG